MSIFSFDFTNFTNFTIREAFYYTLFIIFSFRVLIFIYKNFIRSRINFVKRYGKGTWALVTGATDGIGKGFVKEFAQMGFNIILVSRSASKLKKVSDEVKKEFGNIQTLEIEYDFNKRNQFNDYMETFDNLKNKFDIGILVNNVGTDYHKSWNEFSNDEVYELLNLNVFPQAMLTRILFNHLEKRQNKSLIINLSSFCSDFPFPMKAVYSSTKIFDHYLSNALRFEHNNGNIDFFSFKPLGVSTPLTGKPADGISILTVKQCVDACLDDVVHERESYGHWLHKIQAYLINIVPEFILHPFLRNFWYTMVMKVEEEKYNKKTN